MKLTSALAALLATTALAGPALAGPIAGYPDASTLSGPETMIGTQSGSTVQISAAQIQALVVDATNQWANPQTFDSASTIYPATNPGLHLNLPYSNSSPPVWGQIFGTSTSPYGDGYCLAESSTSALGNCALFWGGGGGGSGSPTAQALVVGADVTNFALPSTVTVNLPEGGKITSGGMALGTGATASSFSLSGSSISHVPTPTATAAGAVAIGVESNTFTITGPLGSTVGNLGGIIEGWQGAFSGGNIDSPVQDLTFENHYGVPVAGLIDGLPNGPLFGIGVGRAVTCTQANEGCPLFAQISIQDQAWGSSQIGVPFLTMQTNGGATNCGFGAAGPLTKDFRIGTIGNQITPWSDVAGGCALDIEDGLRVGFQNGSAAANSGGVGLTLDLWLKDCSGGGMLCVYNNAGSGLMPIEASAIVLAATTVSGLPASPVVGERATVTDATSCSFNGAVTGGGSTKCPVVYLGSWVGG